MIVNQDVTKKIAQLSRLQLSNQELEKYTGELEKILGFVAQLSEVNVQGVEPSIHGIPLESQLREDEPKPLTEAETQKIVACSEQSMYGQFRVPQVIGGE